jgi:hypothetical protein
MIALIQVYFQNHIVGNHSGKTIEWHGIVLFLKATE